MVRIAVVAVALSVCVMILSLAVIMGFKREITERVVGFAAHVEVVDLRGVRSLESYPVQRSAELEETIRSAGRVERMAPYAVKGGVVKTPDAILGVRLKGVDGSYDWSFFRENLTDGALPRVGDSVRTKEILISESVARELELGVGDKVEMLFVESSGQPRRDRFKISGLYATGMNEFDRSVVMTDLRKDDEFNVNDWPADSDNYSIDVVTVAESVDGELFVYVYNPSALQKPLYATSINISTGILEDMACVVAVLFQYNYNLFGVYRFLSVFRCVV